MAHPDAERWLDEHGGAMFRYARLRLRDDAAAEDAVQEALLAAMRATRRGGSAERTWLIGILRHKVVDAIRAQSRAAPVDPKALLAEDGTPFMLGLWRRKQTQASADAVVSLDEREVHEALAAGLDGLPELMRRALLLSEIDGLDAETVSKVLGIRPTYVWTLVHRAKVRLRDRLEAFSGPGGGPGKDAR